MLKFIMLTNLIMAITLTMMKSPLSSNLIILIQTLSLTLMINLINKTSWISFMIFILYIGGLMIIFLYISSIAFNELNINKNFKNLIYKLIFIILVLMYFKMSLNLNNMNYENKFMFEDNFYMLNMFILPNNLMMYMIMFILFFMLILIIWMLKINKGPIRQKK
ncbi:NADH dehydrogenase subunit 6 (mitochondrion) [Diuraphis noxia]|uniref:NADH dehydrogenase subunit 6 n=1 Tax=Diuraphis noxia TaxID=143948 RepID=I1U779_DIUNO|nr:NADH dehydrogenase subunit 6 [Diuraphis noxia]AFI13732.1 NADH dehydrogenase subunit 6 [Diuraphis noxia]AFI13738.1 NADH dehydrogenase subunit 6 [Diuraphis noxia]AFI13741.1 NADH dehydrogenase subunit 6 [Diuraphis noxia]AFI13744.1 NADH dehydrogenase subunit 6 [Diuraphis noxia]AFI13747.1 NADH dehydrogenase subunit 6 [Diuraphis noxia]